MIDHIIYIMIWKNTQNNTFKKFLVFVCLCVIAVFKYHLFVLGGQQKI